MPRNQPRSTGKPRRYVVDGIRKGSGIWTVAGFFTNGALTSVKVADALKAMGYEPRELAEGESGEPESAEADEEEIDAANRILGIDRLEDGRTRLQSEIDKGTRDFTTAAGLRRLAMGSLF